MKEKLWRHSVLARWSFRPESGGAERQFEYYVRAFSNMSERVTVFCDNYRGNTKRLGSNVSVESLCCSHAAFLNRINRAVRIGRPDIVHANEMIPGVISIRIGDGVHAKFLKNMQTYNHGLNRLRFHPWLHRRKLDWERNTVSHSSLSHIIAPSQMCIDDLYENYKEITCHTSVIHNVIASKYVDTPLDTGKGSRALNILFVGSGYRRKGLQILLRSLARVNRQFTLRIVGKDSNQSSYQSLARELGIEKNVFWLGPLEDLVPIFRETDLLALPALYEPAGNVVLEALAMGVKVLVSEFVGYKSFVRSDTGFVVSLNEREVAASIEQFVPSLNRQQIRDSVTHLNEAYFQDALMRFYKGAV